MGTWGKNKAKKKRSVICDKSITSPLSQITILDYTTHYQKVNFQFNLSIDPPLSTNILLAYPKVLILSYQKYCIFNKIQRFFLCLVQGGQDEEMTESQETNESQGTSESQEGGTEQNYDFSGDLKYEGEP